MSPLRFSSIANSGIAAAPSKSFVSDRPPRSARTLVGLPPISPE